MQVSGTATLNAPAQRVWQTLLDPALLARTIPGCEHLEAVGPDHYRGTVAIGVAAIKGAFQGEVKLTDLEEPRSLVLRASGAGGAGTVRADVAVRLTDLGDGRTEVGYDATAVVGGMVGGVGQRVLAGVARKTAGEFFAAVDRELAAPAGAATSTGALDTVGGGQADVAPADTVAGATYPGRAAAEASAARTPGDFVTGVVVGAAIALVGVAVGAILGRRASGGGARH